MEQQVVKYDVNAAEIAKMSDIYMGLTIKDLDDHAGFESVHSARIVMVRHRTGVDKLRKSANETAQKFIKNNNANAKKLTGLMEPIETHLKTEEDKITKEKERIKAQEEKLEQERIKRKVDALFAVNVVMPFFDVALLSDEGYGILLEKSIRIAEEKTRLAEEEKLAKEKAEKELVAERAELEKLRAEQEAIAKGQKEERQKLAAEKHAIEVAKQAKIDRKEREAFEKQAKEDARIQAEKDAKVRAEKEALETQEKAEREAKELKTKEEAKAVEKIRQAELLPDKEKLIDLAMTIKQIISPPAIKDEVVKEIISVTLYELSSIADNVIKQAEDL